MLSRGSFHPKKVMSARMSASGLYMGTLGAITGVGARFKQTKDQSILIETARIGKKNFKKNTSLHLDSIPEQQNSKSRPPLLKSSVHP